MSRFQPSDSIKFVKKIRGNGKYRRVGRGFAAYEQLKREWDQLHPDATPEQRDVAMMRITRKCGV
jgi:hypothetical protein